MKATNLTPKDPKIFALRPATAVGAVAAFTLLIAGAYSRLSTLSTLSGRFLSVLGTFLLVSYTLYRWRLYRRSRDPHAYSPSSPGAWSLEGDWRHQLGLWAAGILAGLAVLGLIALLDRLS